MNRNKREGMLLLLFILPVLPGFSQWKTEPVVHDQLEVSQREHLNGHLGSRLEVAYKNRILAQDDDRLVAPFRNRTETWRWQTEFWGKWFTSAVAAYSYQPQEALKKVLDRTVPDILRAQTTDGYLGNYADNSRLEQWDIWGQKYTLLGLLASYDLKKDAHTLEAACKMTDNLINELALRGKSIARQGNYFGMAASSVLKPVIMLYQRTGQKKYLDFAEGIVRQWESPDGPQLLSKAEVDVGSRFPFPLAGEWVKQGQKAYEMMSCYEGLLDLYRFTGKEAYKTAVIKTWENILRTEINIIGSGSASECWYGGKGLQQHVTKHANETCVTVTWLMLSGQLLRLTGESKYADAIERSYYNALLGAMTLDGTDWGMYTPPAGTRSLGTNQCDMGLNCCVANGPRGLFTLPPLAVMGGKKGVTINFFADGTYKVADEGKQVIEIEQQTAYPVDGKVTIRVGETPAKEFPVSIRVPGWSSHTVLTVNGQQVEVPASGSYITVTRRWNSGDSLVLQLDMSGRIEKIEGQPSYLAVTRGPLVLARDTRWTNNVDIDEIITPVLAPDGTVPMEILPQGDTWMSVVIPCLTGSWRLGEEAIPVRLTFCDFSSAGSTFSPASRYRFWFPQLIGENWGG